MKWKTLGGEEVPDIVQFVRDNVTDEQVVHIGTDSLQTGRYTQFVTVLVIHTPPKGGRVLYCREIVPRITSLHQRLTKEVWKSIGVAMELPEGTDLTVHIDANSDERYASSKYVESLVGMVMSQGFKAVWKPDSWASTHAADHIVRTLNVRPRREHDKTGRVR